MSNTLSGLRTLLLATSGVTALLGTSTDGVFAAHVPSGTQRPYVVMHGISGPGHHHLRGASAIENPLIQVECWAATSLAADGLADAVIAALDGYRGSMGSSQFVAKGIFKRDRRGPMATDPQDASEQQLWSVQIDFEVWRA